MLDVLNSLSSLFELVMQGHGSLTGSLRVEFSWVRDLEEDVLHDVASVWALELELLAFEENIVETPDLSGEDRVDGSNTTILHHKSEVDCSGAGVSGSPGLAGHGVWCMAVSSEGLAINPGL